MDTEIGNDIGALLFSLGLFALITTVIVTVIWQSFATVRARASVAREEASRRLVEQATGAMQKMAEEQQKIMQNLDELRVRIVAIEKMLREVE